MLVFEFIILMVLRELHEVLRKNVPYPDISLKEGVFVVVNSGGWGSILLAVAHSGHISSRGINRLLEVVRREMDSCLGMDRFVPESHAGNEAAFL